MKRVWLLLLAAGLTSGCGNFRQPPLPEGAAASAPAVAPVDPAWAAKLLQADAIYFSLTISSNTEMEPAWQIIQVLQRGGGTLALGWAGIAATQQPLFEQWKRKEISSAQVLDGIVRPAGDAWLRQALRPDLGQVALGSSRELLGKIRSGKDLSAEERAQLPSGFRPRAEALENFIERASASPRLRRYNLRHLYRAHLVAEQTIAENIVAFRREHPAVKLLIFLPNDIMIDPAEVAYFAAQKMPLRQLILDRSQPLREARPELLVRRSRGRLEIVNRPPAAAADDRGLPAPRLRT